MAGLKARHVAPADAGEPTGAGDEREAQHAHTPQDVRVGALTGAPAEWGTGIEPEALDEPKEVEQEGEADGSTT